MLTCDNDTQGKQIYFQKRTKSMCEQVENLSGRYEGLEIRRKREAEGYQADISALKQKLKHLEQQLVRATINKAKGKTLVSFSAHSHFTPPPSAY